MDSYAHVDSRERVPLEGSALLSNDEVARTVKNAV